MLLFTGITLPSARGGGRGRLWKRRVTASILVRLAMAVTPKASLHVLPNQPEFEDNRDPKRKAKVITVFPTVLKF